MAREGVGPAGSRRSQREARQQPGPEVCGAPSLRTSPAWILLPRKENLRAGTAASWTRRPPHLQIVKNHATTPATPSPCTHQPADPSLLGEPEAALSQCKVLYGKRRFLSSIEPYIVAENVALPWRTLPRRKERYFAAEKVPSAHRTLFWLGEGYFAAENLPSPQRTLHCDKEVDFATKKLTSRQRSLHCAEEAYIAPKQPKSTPRRLFPGQRPTSPAAASPDAPDGTCASGRAGPASAARGRSRSGTGP
jgi:hypothetical protein